MKRKAQCVICTRDEAISRQLSGWLSERYLLTNAGDVEAAGILIQQHIACVLLIDLRVPRSLELLEWLVELRSSCAVICFGEERSRPALMAEERGVTELHPFHPERKALQAAVARAAELSELRADNKMLQARSILPPSAPRTETFGSHDEESLAEIERAGLCLGDPEFLLSQSVELVSRALQCGRVTLYLLDDTEERFVPSASIGVRLDSVLAMGATSGLAAWMKVHCRIMAYSVLHRAEGTEERLMIASTLTALQADAIAPLADRSNLIGWIAVGAPIMGGHLEAGELSRLMRLCTSLSKPIVRSQEYRKVGFKRRLLETVFETLPTTVIAVNPQEEVIWLNRSAIAHLQVTLEEVVGRRLEDVSPDLSKTARRLVAAKVPEGGMFKTPSGIPMFVHAQSFPFPVSRASDQALGFLLTLQDASMMERLREEREAAFRREALSEMTTAMAFKIRAPLSTIKTFTHLLPERRGDAEFTERYRRLIANDVDRLEELSNSMHEFSLVQGPPTTESRKMHFSVPQLIDLVRCLTGDAWHSVQVSLGDDLPTIQGNCSRLAEGLCHLLSNAKEANTGQPAQTIELRIARENVTQNLIALAISVTDRRAVQKVGAFVDNSHLRSEDAQERANLRLKFAAEIVQEFAGDLTLATTEQGATVKLLLIA